MKSIKKSLRYIFLFFLIIGTIVLIVVASGMLFFVFDKQGYCLSEGKGVWDDDQKICRQDCLTWNKKDGCVPITKENIKKKEQGIF